MRFDFELAVENAEWPVLLVSNSGVIEHANLAAIAAFGDGMNIGSALAASFSSPEMELKTFLDRLARPGSEAIQVQLRTKTGQTARFQAHASPSARSKESAPSLLLQLFPVPQSTPSLAASELASAGKAGATGPDTSLIHQQKLECALQLARTVALDFNNALTSILGHTSLLVSKVPADHPWRSSLVEIEKSAEKAAEVAADLAAFSRQETTVKSQVAGNLNEVVRRTVEAFQVAGSRPIAWTVQLEPRLYTASFDEAKMQQAFSKILDNAIQALPDRGRLTVTTRNRDVAQAAQDGTVRLGPGHYVCVEFDDGGCGIPSEVLPRIFEPFFTTKRAPDHRGLGLAWVYGIVTNHGGSVSVASQVGRGTTVRVYLPAQKKIVRDRGMQSAELSGTETILMIDDEELLLTMGEMVLSSFGYTVITANSGQKAIELFKKNLNRIHLVITDLVMPRMSGREVVQQLRLLSPSVKIICSSGYVQKIEAEEEELYLQKPFTSIDLLRKVKQALTRTEGS